MTSATGRILLLVGLSTLAGGGLSAAARADIDNTTWPLYDKCFRLEVEIGAVWQAHNEVQIPNDARGTRFSLEQLVGQGSWPAGRLYLTWQINRRHALRALAAPFQYTETGVFTEPVDFAGATYTADALTEATYKFNSWRLSYIYTLHAGERWRWTIGLTAKIRDARIALQQGETSSEDTDVGFVPLLHLAGGFRFATRWSLRLDVDALAGGPGRAVDGAFKVVYDVSPGGSLTFGYRTLEGGADVESVYNFAWFNYAVVSLDWAF